MEKHKEKYYLYELYHENSKLRSIDIGLYSWIGYINEAAQIRDKISKPNYKYKGYQKIFLSKTKKSIDPKKDFHDIIINRRSHREFSPEPISLENLSHLLYYSNGITEIKTFEDRTTWQLRTTPSGGALYPIEIYCAIQNVQGIDSGIYFFNPIENCIYQLQKISNENIKKTLTDSMPGLADTYNNSAVTIMLTSFMPRIRFKYKERAYRFALMEIGHIAQNLILSAEYEMLGAICIGGFMDNILNDLIKADGVDRSVQYCVAIGKKA